MADTAANLHRAVLDLLLEKVEADPYPSATMMNMIEEMLAPDEVETYAEILLDKMRADRFPSISMLARVRALESSARRASAAPAVSDARPRRLELSQ